MPVSKNQPVSKNPPTSRNQPTPGSPHLGHIADLTRRAAAGHPDRLGLVDDTTQLTWAEVDRRVVAVAQVLAERGVAKGDRVVVSATKSIETFLALHALLRLGAVVVPVDPRSPAASLASIRVQADAESLIANPAVVARQDAARPWRIALSVDDLANVRLDDDAATAAEFPLVEPDDEAYVIFTSGSTGVPKGIVHTHRSAAAYVVHAADAHGLCADDVVAGIAPLHFDMSTLELYVAPFVGAAVAPVADSVLRFAASVVAHTVRHQATVWYLVPSLLTSMIEANLLSTESVPSLRLVAYAGEPYPGPKVAALVERLPGVRIQNVYGPAETNAVSVYDVGPDTAFHDAVPLGWAWSGAVFDVRGDNSELWLAADTMMQGYLGRPDLTAERMETDSRGQRWYRSGDVVRLTDDGWVFAGRVDHQIKLRGVRLELEALEALLEGLDGVSVAVVAGYPADQPVELVAGIVATDAASSGVAAQARRVLPASATPIEITRLSEVPNTQSGKVDRSRIRTSLRQRKAADQPVATQPVATQPVATQITHESPA